MQQTDISDKDKEFALHFYNVLVGFLLFIITYSLAEFTFLQAFLSSLLGASLSYILGTFVVNVIKSTKALSLFYNAVVSFVIVYLIITLATSFHAPMTELYSFRLGEAVTEKRLNDLDEDGMSWRAIDESSEHDHNKLWTYQLTDPMRPETKINLYLNPDDLSLMRIEVIADVIADRGSYKHRELRQLKDALEEGFDSQYGWPLGKFDLRNYSMVKQGAWHEFYNEIPFIFYKGMRNWNDGQNDQWMSFYSVRDRSRLRIVLQDTEKLDEWVKKQVDVQDEQDKQVASMKASRILGQVK